MARVVIVLAHPAFERSRVNRRMVESVTGLEGVEVRDLLEEYADFDVDVRREQSLLADAQVVVFQHPFFWYSAPAILKQWQDLVLEHGWAYGDTGRALHGKRVLHAITAGGGEDSYARDGIHRFTVGELLAPFEQTAKLCGMEWLPPFVVHGTHGLSEPEITRHADDYRRLVLALRDGSIDGRAARLLPRVNADLAAVLRG